MLDPQNWNETCKNLKTGFLTNEAVETAVHHSVNKPKHNTKFGKLRIRPKETQLFPGVRTMEEALENPLDNNSSVEGSPARVG